MFEGLLIYAQDVISYKKTQGVNLFIISWISPCGQCNFRYYREMSRVFTELRSREKRMLVSYSGGPVFKYLTIK
jgi:hemolysin-activating ACP:hemolysin acyltransferase